MYITKDTILLTWKKWTCTFPDKIKIHVYWSNNSNNKIMTIIPEQAPSVWSMLGVCSSLTFNMNLKLQPQIYLWLGSCQSDLLTTWVMTFDQFNDPGRSWMATKQLQTKALGTFVNHLSRLQMDVGIWNTDDVTRVLYGIQDIASVSKYHLHPIYIWESEVSQLATSGTIAGQTYLHKKIQKPPTSHKS